MKTKILTFTDRFKYELGILALLLVQALFNLKRIMGMDGNFLVYYLSDFSMAKTSRMLVGTFVNLLTDHPTERWINNFARIVLFATIVFVAVLLGRIVRKVDADKRLPIYVLILFFCTGTFTMHIFSAFFGMMDIYMFMFAAVSIACLQNRFLRWIVPLLCLAGVLINIVFIFSFFPAVLLVILYLAAFSEKKAGYIVLFCITALSVLALTYYCGFMFEGTVAVTVEEMRAIMERKFCAPVSDEQLEYFTAYIFGTDTDGQNFLTGNIHDMSLNMLVKTLSDFMLSERLDTRGLMSLGVGAVPVMAAFWGIWIGCIRKTKESGKKFVYLCFILSALCIPFCLVLSTDPIRWYAAGVMTQFALGFYMFYAKDKAFAETVEAIRKFFEDKKIIFLLIFLAYVFIRHSELA